MRALPCLSSLVLVAATAGGCTRGREEPREAAPVVELQTTPEPAPVDAALAEARAKLGAGDEAGAVAAFDRALAALPDAPDNAARRHDVRCALASVFNNRAQRLFEKDARVGEDEARRALALCPDNDVIKGNLAALLNERAHREGVANADARGRAIAWMEESLKLRDDGPVHANLGAAYFMDDKLEDAVRHLEIAQRMLPDDVGVPKLLADARRKLDVEGGFRDQRHQHFVAKFEGYAQERLAWSALDLLEQAYFSVGSRLNLYPADPITVVIYTGDQYKQAVNLPDWVQGSYDGKIRIREGALAAANGELQSMLRHEYTHALVATLPSRVPAWMNEGLAKYFESDDVGNALAFVKRTRAKLPLTAWDTLQLPSFTGISDTQEAQLAYAISMSLVAALVEKRGEYALQSLMSRLKNGETFEDAFTSTYAVSPRGHYDAWAESL
jgi:tetratricopeptide (TPR) repeat protein